MRVEVKNRARWMSSTSSALAALAQYFPPPAPPAGAKGTGFLGLSAADFPCQKVDTGHRCAGWNWQTLPDSIGRGSATVCPCFRGRMLVLSPLLELAGEFKEVTSCPVEGSSIELSAFAEVVSDVDMRCRILSWMYLVACGEYPEMQSEHDLLGLIEMPLSETQRQSMRWWGRLIELNQLVNNQFVTILTRSAIEKVYNRDGWVGLSKGLDQLKIPSGGLVLLCVNGLPLVSAGQQSGRLDWLEGFLSCVDEKRFGLSVLAKQPLLEPEQRRPEKAVTTFSDYRWQSKSKTSLQSGSFERLLRRGTWDRLLEALARADHLIHQRR
jgi:hypothetical protein